MKALWQWALLTMVIVVATVYFVFAGGNGPCIYPQSLGNYDCLRNHEHK